MNTFLEHEFLQKIVQCPTSNGYFRSTQFFGWASMSQRINNLQSHGCWSSENPVNIKYIHLNKRIVVATNEFLRIYVGFHSNDAVGYFDTA
jgi:hypothetical protein